MEFCKKCGKPLKIKEGMVECSCGFTKISDSKISSTEKIKKPEEKGEGVLGGDSWVEGCAYSEARCWGY